MDMMYLLIDVLLVFYGAKALYEWFQMKRSGELLPESKMLYPSNVSLKECKDQEGYYAYIMPHFLVFGIVTSLAGILSLVVDYAKLLPGNFNFGVIAVLIIVVVYFSFIIRRGYKRFF